MVASGFRGWGFIRCFALLALIVVVSFSGCSSGEIDQTLAAKIAQYAEDAKSSLASRDYDAVIELTNKCLESGLLQQQLLADVVAMRVKAFLGKGELDQARDEISLLESVAVDPTSVHGLKYLYWTKKGDISSAERELSQARIIDPSFSPPR
jgi:hypothetical protein